MKTGAGLVAFAAARIGNWYMYGVNDQIITEALIQSKARQYPTHYTAAHIAELRRHIGMMADQCNSFTTLYVGQSATHYHPLNADGWYGSCPEKGILNYNDPSKPILRIPEVPGYIVHKAGHMGIYEGNGVVIEAKGTWEGVVRTQIDNRRNLRGILEPWTGWGRVLEVDYSGGNDMIFCQKGQGSSAQPDPEVMSVQKCFEALGIRMINDAGKEYFADGSYGGATANGVKLFEAANNLPLTNGEVFSDVHVRALLASLTKLMVDGRKSLDLANQLVTGLQTSNRKLETKIVNGIAALQAP